MDERNQTYSDTAIQCCLMINALFRLSLGMVTGFVQSLIKLCGLDWAAPDYSTICRRQKHIEIQISYKKSCNGLHLLVDSTGLNFLGDGEWKCKKHQLKYRLHIGINAKTMQIRAIQLTTNHVSDSQKLGDLLDQIPQDELTLYIQQRPLSPVIAKNLPEDLIVRWTCHSNVIEGNLLTLLETTVVLEGITVGGKTLREHCEAIHHRNAIYYIEDII